MALFRLFPAMATHHGMRRRYNEDAIGYVYPSDATTLSSYGALFIVADGVGSVAAGGQASQLAVEKLKKSYYKAQETVKPEERLQTAIQNLNSEIFTELNQTGATTLIATVILGEKLIIASIGDSQIFHIKENNIVQLNELDIVEVEGANYGNLTKAVGHRKRINIQTKVINIQENEHVLLCSDGLTRYINNEKLLKLSTMQDPRDSVRLMIDMANNLGGADNISAILIKIANPMKVENIAKHIQSISVRIAVETKAFIKVDVPSKPRTQIPLSASQAQKIEDLLDEVDVSNKDFVDTSKSVINSSTMQATGNRNILFIFTALIVLTFIIIFILALSGGSN